LARSIIVEKDSILPPPDNLSVCSFQQT